ncbi:MAG: hypothetical protein FWF79_01640 [Defluviitaleaceae bacterium]|nr:hypothetical protein [Defluviitaleaceae bacterium]
MDLFVKLIFLACAAVAAFIAVVTFANVVVLYAAAFAFFAVFLAWVLTPRLKTVVFVCGLGVVSFVFHLTFVLNVHTQPVSDFALLYNAAVSVASGDFSVLHESLYFQTWAYQTGFVAFQAFFIRFFGAGITFLKVVNVLFIVVTNLLVYALARKFVSEAKARCIGCMYMVFPGILFLSPVLTNQHAANALFLLGIFIYLNKNGTLWAERAGLVFALGNAIRPMAIVIIGAILFTEFLRFIFEYKRFNSIKSKDFKPFLRPVLMTGAYLLVGIVLSFAVRASGLNPNGLSNQFPGWKFAVGFNYQATGQWNLQDDTELFAITDFALRDARAREMFFERLSAGPREILPLFYRKARIMWTSPDASEWAFGHLGYPVPRVSFLQEMSLAFSGGAATLLAISAYLLFKRFNAQQFKDFFAPLLLTVIFLFYFGAHLLIEVQERYRDFGLIFVFILAAYALDAKLHTLIFQCDNN